MKRIPSKFRLGSLEFTVQRVTPEEMRELTEGHDAYGYFVPDTQSIYVLRAGRGCSAALASQAFWHEVGHALLWVMNHKDYTNETVVDHIGHLLKQFHDTAE